MLIPIGFFVKGPEWQKFTVPVSNDFLTSTYASFHSTNYKFLVAHDASSNWLSSEDGSTWSTVSGPTGNIKRLASSSNITVAVGPNTVGYSTTNGFTWTSRTIWSNAVPSYDIIWDGTRFLVTGGGASSGGNLAHSTDGITWSKTFVAGGTSSLSRRIGFGGTTYVILPPFSQSSASGYVCTSTPTNGGNWSAITMPSTGYWSSIAYANGVFVACRAGSTAYATSTNGSTWTARTLPYKFTDTTADELSTMGVHNSTFYYFGNNTVYESIDGINWTSTAVDTTSATLINVNTWTSVGSLIYGFGDTGRFNVSTVAIKGS